MKAKTTPDGLEFEFPRWLKTMLFSGGGVLLAFMATLVWNSWETKLATLERRQIDTVSRTDAVQTETLVQHETRLRYYEADRKEFLDTLRTIQVAMSAQAAQMSALTDRMERIERRAR